MGRVERLIFTVKELTSCDFRDMPYKKFPKLMVVSSLEADITWLDIFPKKNGTYKKLSPSEIVLGTSKIDTTRAILQPGLYVYCKFKVIITNSIKTRSVVEITLRRSNECGGHCLISLKTGCQINIYPFQ